MPPGSGQGYASLPISDKSGSEADQSSIWTDSKYNDNDSEAEMAIHYEKPSRRRRLLPILMFVAKIIALALVALLVYTTWELHSILKTQTNSQSPNSRATANLAEERCIRPTVRPSWNKMDRQEKQSYIDAVLCMTQKPSYLHANSSVYDDFSHIHIVHGSSIHFAAGNLPWHRLHLLAWEQALRRECGYPGSLPYWEWELEWEDPLNSPIFDAEIGFGGDGDQSAGHMADDDWGAFSLDASRCIQSGPFVNVRPQWFAEIPAGRPLSLEYNPHCVTRAFTDTFKNPIAKPFADSEWDFSPERVTEVMEMDDFHEFGAAAEELHNWLPRSIRGEYASLGGPNDPTFYLHLCNIDRIWWQWQQRNSQKHLMAYYGEAENDRSANASLDDPLAFSAIPGIRPVVVREMMNSQSGALGMCYRY